MKKVLCLLFSIMLLVSLCGCQNATDNSSESDTKIIIEEIVETQGNNNSGSQNITGNIVRDTSNMGNVGNNGNTSNTVDNNNTQNNNSVTAQNAGNSSNTQNNNSSTVSNAGNSDNTQNNNSATTQNAGNSSNIQNNSSATAQNAGNSSNIQNNSSTQNTSSMDGVSSSKPSDSITNSNIYKLNDSEVLKNIKLNGRCEKLPNGISLGMSASAIEFNTDSTAIFLEADCASDIYYSIVVDGQTVQEREVTTSGTNYIFVRGLTAGTHNIKIIRDCEGRTDKHFIVMSLQLDDGKLLDKDADNTVIEFLGDSLTSGYGNMVVNGIPNPQELKNQSAMVAYPYLIANKLGFDYRIVSQSGIALTKRDGYLAFPDYYNLENYHLDREKIYTSSNPQAVDIVVVNLGTNDIGSGLYNNNSRDDANAYIKHYADLITNIGYRKDAKIIFVSGIWYNDPAIADGGVENELKSRGYNNVYALSFAKQYKSGGGGHPSKAEHQEIADTIIKFFQDKGIA